MNKQSIVFAHYKNGELLGYRQDTMGTIGTDWAKIYVYSPEQVETVIKNIRYMLGDKKRGLGETLEQLGAVVFTQDGKECGANIITEAEERIYQQGQDAGAFEVRVVKCPVSKYERELNLKTGEWEEVYQMDYPKEQMDIWLAKPEEHETIETHQFSLVGELNMQ